MVVSSVFLQVSSAVGRVICFPAGFFCFWFASLLLCLGVRGGGGGGGGMGRGEGERREGGRGVDGLGGFVAPISDLVGNPLALQTRSRQIPGTMGPG